MLPRRFASLNVSPLCLAAVRQRRASKSELSYFSGICLLKDLNAASVQNRSASIAQGSNASPLTLPSPALPCTQSPPIQWHAVWGWNVRLQHPSWAIWKALRLLLNLWVRKPSHVSRVCGLWESHGTVVALFEDSQQCVAASLSAPTPCAAAPIQHLCVPVFIFILFKWF